MVAGVVGRVIVMVKLCGVVARPGPGEMRSGNNRATSHRPISACE